MTTIRKLALLAALVAASATQAQDTGFLTSYDNLSPNEELGFKQVYIAPGASESIARFNQVMIDQPEVIIAADSKYRGAKPQDTLAVAETLRAGMVQGIGDRFPVVNAPGDGAALMSWAVSNVYLKKRKRGLLNYTPVGAVAYGARQMASDVVDKTRAYDVVLEFEMTDSVTGEVLFAAIVDLSEAGEQVEFDSLLSLAYGFGQRLGCRLNNARVAEADREDCAAIPIERGS